MPSSPRTCQTCGSEFYGRADAAYCTTACRQKAHRQRSRNATTVTATPVIRDDRPVPDGDAWMVGRFGGEDGDSYSTVASTRAHILATVKGKITQEKKIAAEERTASLVIPDYVDKVATIGRYDYDYDNDNDYERECATPLGDELPASIDPITARVLADKLEAALPRVAELAALLRRRGQ